MELIPILLDDNNNYENFITTDSTYTKLYTAVIVRFIKFINIWFNSLL